MSTTVAKPFIKWAGGKTQLLADIEKCLPEGFDAGKWDTYVEPFVGGGAVLFWILQKYPNIKRAVINDINPKLITAYRVVKEVPEALIGRLDVIQEEYRRLSADERAQYYSEKRAEFNFSALTDIEQTALFIFLNRTCFNGLYRVNSKDEFNVPFGKYPNPQICDRENIVAVSRVLQKVEIMCGDFTKTAQYISPSTLFYFDPPYKPISKTSSFTAYSKENFNDDDQIRLRDFCVRLAENRTMFILSSSDVNTAESENDFFDRLYDRFEIRRVMASRMVNADPNKRGKLSELLISNSNSTMRNFNDWMRNLRPSIADYKYYVDFNKIFANVDTIKVELNILNSLIGSRNIESDFGDLVAKYPEVLKCIPILLAKRQSEIPAMDKNGAFCYNFAKMNCSVEQYKVFMRETGLFDLLANHIVNNLVDYVTGVETGLDSNGRKNRGGHLMENLVESYIQKAGFVKGVTYFKEMKIGDIEKRWSVDLSSISNKGKVVKRFDFVVKTDTCVYAVETNFYTGGGSKLNETARSYKTIALESKNLENFKFVWFTDGAGWQSARHNLEETFEVLEDLYNVHDLEQNIIEKVMI